MASGFPAAPHGPSCARRSRTPAGRPVETGQGPAVARPLLHVLWAVQDSPAASLRSVCLNLPRSARKGTLKFG
jgi:hypothetical protein